MPAIFVKGGAWIAGVAATAVVTVAGVGTLAVRERQSSLSVPAPVHAPDAAQARGPALPAPAAAASVKPATVVARADPAAPTPKALPAAAAVEAATFDVLRIEPSGEAVIAGRAPGDSRVSLLDRGVMIASAEVAANGEFVFLPPPLEAGEHDLRLRVSKGGSTQLSAESARVIVPASAGGRFLVSLEAPGQPPRVFADDKPRAPVKEASAPVLPNRPEPAAPAPVRPATPLPPLAALEPKITAPPQLFGSRDRPAATAPSAASQPVVIRTIAIAADGSFRALGAAAPGHRVELQMNGSLVATVVADGSGHWSLQIVHGMRPGAYVLRAEDVAATGMILSHADAPFDYRVPAAALPTPQANVASTTPASPEPAAPLRALAATPPAPTTLTTPPSGSATTRTVPRPRSGNPPSSTPVPRPDMAVAAGIDAVAEGPAHAPSATPGPRLVVSLERQSTAAPLSKPAPVPSPAGGSPAAPQPMETDRRASAAPATPPEKPQHRLAIVAEREPGPADRREAPAVAPAAPLVHPPEAAAPSSIPAQPAPKPQPALASPAPAKAVPAASTQTKPQVPPLPKTEGPASRGHAIAGQAIASPETAGADLSQPVKPSIVRYPAAAIPLSEATAPPAPQPGTSPGATPPTLASGDGDNADRAATPAGRPTAAAVVSRAAPQTMPTAPSATKRAAAEVPPVAVAPARPTQSPPAANIDPLRPARPAQDAVADLSAATTVPVLSPSAAEMSSPADAVVPELQTTMVAPGDSLWSLSQKLYGDATQFVRIYEANADRIYDPWLIYPGQILVVPSPPVN